MSSVAGYEYASQSFSRGGAVPMMIHHGLRDEFVNPAGCCSSLKAPCCCSISAEKCVSVVDFWRKWGFINGCQSPPSQQLPSLVQRAHQQKRCYALSYCNVSTLLCLHPSRGHVDIMDGTLNPNHTENVIADIIQFFHRVDGLKYFENGREQLNRTIH